MLTLYYGRIVLSKSVLVDSFVLLYVDSWSKATRNGKNCCKMLPFIGYVNELEAVASSVSYLENIYQMSLYVMALE